MRCNGNSHSPDNIQTVRMSARGGSEQKIYSIARANGTATSQLSALIFLCKISTAREGSPRACALWSVMADPFSSAGLRRRGLGRKLAWLTHVTGSECACGTSSS